MSDQLSTNINYCKGKPCYDKKGALTAKNKRFEEDHQRLRIYNCPDCNYWHLTKILKGDYYDER